jgi:ABC-type Fe3+-hydroxamate transport system substrate-binding protein
MVSKKESPLDPSDNVRLAFEKEIGFDLDSIRTYLNFSKRIDKLRNEMHDFIKKIKSENKTISAIGASTKGNVLLQYYGLDSEILDYIGEVNELKFNCFTPGSLISIISEEKVLDRNPDYLLILPWHFRTFFLNNKKFKGYKLVFPLPALEIVDNV